MAFIQSMPWLTPIVICAVGLGLAFLAKRHMTFSVVCLQLFLLFVGSWAAYRLELRQETQAKITAGLARSQRQIKHERVLRSKVQSEINRYVCTENNKQDRVLAGLVQASVSGQTAFGAGIDRSSLSPFDGEVLLAINKVQRLTEATGAQADLKSAFNQALAQLRNETPCATLVSAFLIASTTDDLKAVREILRKASRDDNRAGVGRGRPAEPNSQRPPKP